MTYQWFCRIAGHDLGPFTPQQLKALAAQGRLHPEDLVRQGESGLWMAGARIRGLFVGSGSGLGPAPSAPPPPPAAAQSSPPGSSSGQGPPPSSGDVATPAPPPPPGGPTVSMRPPAPAVTPPSRPGGMARAGTGENAPFVVGDDGLPDRFRRRFSRHSVWRPRHKNAPLVLWLSLGTGGLLLVLLSVLFFDADWLAVESVPAATSPHREATIEEEIIDLDRLNLDRPWRPTSIGKPR